MAALEPELGPDPSPRAGAVGVRLVDAPPDRIAGGGATADPTPRPSPGPAAFGLGLGGCPIPPIIAPKLPRPAEVGFLEGTAKPRAAGPIPLPLVRGTARLGVLVVPIALPNDEKEEEGVEDLFPAPLVTAEEEEDGWLARNKVCILCTTSCDDNEDGDGVREATAVG